MFIVIYMSTDGDARLRQKEQLVDLNRLATVKAEILVQEKLGTPGKEITLYIRACPLVRYKESHMICSYTKHYTRWYQQPLVYNTSSTSYQWWILVSLHHDGTYSLRKFTVPHQLNTNTD